MGRALGTERTPGACAQGTHSKTAWQQLGKVRRGAEKCRWQGTAGEQEHREGRAQSARDQATGRGSMCQARKSGIYSEGTGEPLKAFEQRGDKIDPPVSEADLDVKTYVIDGEGLHKGT